MKIERMNYAEALEYTAWQYAPPYTFYNIPAEAQEETLGEIFAEAGAGQYYAVLDDSGELFGMYEYSFSNGTMEIGLGIAPQHCGQGNGVEFVEQCIAFGRKNYAYTGPVSLMVADFNTRAIHLYKKIGFAKTGVHQTTSFGIPVTFVKMERC